jgi:hypothetical protein
MKKFGMIAVAAILFTPILASLAQVTPPGGDPPATGAPVSVSLAADKKSYSAKDPVKLTLTAKNTKTMSAKLMFTSGMKYDFEIRKGKAPNGEKVWQWSKGRMFTMMVQFVNLDPGKSLVFTETYTPGDKDAMGKPLPELAPGTYTATGILAIGGRMPRPMATTVFTVK